FRLPQPRVLNHPHETPRLRRASCQPPLTSRSLNRSPFVGPHRYGHGMTDDENAGSRDVALLVAATKKLGERAEWTWPGGYPNALALCAIDSVYSLRARYTGVT